MSLFHVYNKFDSMDLVHVAARSEAAALSIAADDGYLTGDLAIPASDLVTLPFTAKDNTSSHVKLIRGEV